MGYRTHQSTKNQAPEKLQSPVHGSAEDGHRWTASVSARLNEPCGAPEPHNAHEQRLTRLTNAFSKKLEDHEVAVALHFMLYNFARIHQTLRITPAMAAGVSDRVWSLEEIVRLID